jgi:hypothetical protein
MIEQIHRLQAINEAIWIRDNATKISRDLLIERLQELSEYSLFSNRQMAKICGNQISHNVLGVYVQKSDKSGGKLNPTSLEDIREALFSKERKRINYNAILRALESGTSQGMVSKLTGISQSTISRKFGEESL